MTTEERKSRLFAQPSAAKEVYRPDGHYLNGHIIVKGPDGLWHMYYAPMVPGEFPQLEPPCDIGETCSPGRTTAPCSNTVVRATAMPMR